MTNEITLFSRIARLPLRQRRAALRLWWHVEKARGHVPGFGLADTFARLLRLPMREALETDREAVFHDWLASLEWLSLVDRPLEEIRRDIDRVEIDDEALFARLASWDKPILLAPLHMGCYPLGLARLMNTHFRGRKMLILRGRDDREAETHVMRRISELGCEMRFLQVKEKSQFLGAVRYARDGAVIVSFIDLPASYGTPCDVSLFDQPARIALGIDAFARLADATIVPLAVTSGLKCDTVRVGHPFDVPDGSPQTRAMVARTFVKHITTTVADHPAQWHMWQRIEEFMVDETPPAAEVA